MYGKEHFLISGKSEKVRFFTSSFEAALILPQSRGAHLELDSELHTCGGPCVDSRLILTVKVFPPLCGRLRTLRPLGVWSTPWLREYKCTRLQWPMPVRLGRLLRLDGTREALR